ncbi:hypothetical protein [Fimbriiglobus ruber]|nr:hypothetical protein [Fimbriiglobus ruber]
MNASIINTTPEDLDPVNFLLGKVNEDRTDKCLDSEDQPCIRLAKDPNRQLYRLYDRDGKVSLRARSYLRNLYRYHRPTLHLSDKDLALAVDYIAEDAYQGGRERTAAVVKKDGDYNFEAVCVFANSLTRSGAAPGLGNRLLDAVARLTTDDRLRHTLTVESDGATLTLKLRTADLWAVVNSSDIEAQVRADKGTLCKALNYFSRRLDDLGYQFRKVGLEVTVTHRDTGSWTTLVRRDDVFCPDPTVLVRPDGPVPSASALSSGDNMNGGKGLQATDDNCIATDPVVSTPAV